MASKRRSRGRYSGPERPVTMTPARSGNGMIDRRPALIASCRGVADVINSVKFARKHELLVAVRGGGHNVAGNAVCDGGLMIDLSGMRSVRVDPMQRTARAEGWGYVG